jgi:hypothetical protein
MTEAQGGCLCGAIRYAVTGAPEFSVVCHCRSCRRAAGAPTVAWVTFPAERFRILQGRPREYASSAAVVRTFCADCGTPLTYRHAGDPRTVDVTTCSLDDENRFAPTEHLWMSHSVAWSCVADGLPQFPDEPERGTGQNQ